MRSLAPADRAGRLAPIVQQLHHIGRTVVAPAAAAVDRDARFPHEAFAALREERLLSCYVPAELGGMGLTLTELCTLCEVLGQYCGSTAMVFAMHQIQVACIVHHSLHEPFFRAYAKEIVEHQRLLASATTEVGVGGDVRTSRCAVEVKDGRFTLEKQAPVISYGEDCDAIIITARRSPDAGPSDQVQVLVRREECSLTPISGWDTMGFRGTCSSGFTVRATGPAHQVAPVPYAEIHGRTMHPFAHCTWASLWLGIATDAVNRARASVRAEARRTPGTLPPSALRLSEVDALLFSMRSGVHLAVAEYEALLSERPEGTLTQDYGFALRINNLKIQTSKLLVEVVGSAMSVAGIAGYRNDSPYSVCRHLRDAYGASLMVANDRILSQSSAMQILRRDES